MNRRWAFALALIPLTSACHRRLESTETSSELAPIASAVPASHATGCPTEMARVATFCVDRWEAHLATRNAAGAIVDVSPFDRPVAGIRYEAVSEKDATPQGYVSRTESALACEHAGKRLCTAREWLSACEGTAPHPYPYGDRERKDACNTGKPHLMQKLFGADMRIYRFDAHYNSPKLNRFPGFLAKTGAFPECVSEAGVFDLVGNLHEWVADPVDATFRKLLTERHVDFHVFETATDGNGAFLGGFYSTREQYGVGCGYITPAHEPAYHDYSTGFRCCQDAR